MSIARTIREQVTEQIRDDVVAGKFPAGEPLREGDLAERFGVSRGPIRDAFLQLAQEGFLAYEANRGVKVRTPPDPKNRQLIVALRQQLEAFVVRTGAQQLTKEHLSSLATALEELRIACESQEVADIARQDVAFHQALLTCCGGEELLPIWRLLCSQMLLTYSRLEVTEQVYQEHLAIYEALESGNRQAALAALKANIR